MGAHHVAGRLVDHLAQNYEPGEELPAGAIEPHVFLPTGSGVKDPSDGATEARWDALRHLVRWAALLHDVGHVPLGHTLEDEFEGIYQKHDDFASPRIPYLWHEVSPGQESEIRRTFRCEDLLPPSFRKLGISGEVVWQTVMLICLHKEGRDEKGRVSFDKLLAKEDKTRAKFVPILEQALKATENKTFFPYMADIVGNTICADYFDYLRRDAINVGLDVLRDNRVAARFFVGRDANGLARMALSLVDKRGKPRLDTCTGVVELVRQRFRFAEIIYYHKTKVAASAMLAKVFNLIGKPEEIGPPSQTIEIDQVTSVAKEVMKGGASRVRQRYSPNSLLSPEIGDETLQFWLQERGWSTLEQAQKSKDEARVVECLRGLSLLQALVRRNLYKVCFAIDANIYSELCPGSHESAEIERKIQATLRDLRQDEIIRTKLETDMADAAGWPADGLLLYVPPRKSQAKGIETGALDRGEVVTLGAHSAVRNEVMRLSDAYKGLWRIILLAHPKYMGDDVGLSSAADALVKGLWPNIDLGAAVTSLRGAAWFNYLPSQQRPAAERYRELISPQKPRWRSFNGAIERTSTGTISTEEHVLRTVLLSNVETAGGSPELIKKSFGPPGSLLSHVSEREKHETHVGREGDSRQADVRLAVLQEIADELIKKPGLF
jgi:HD superfamily phosphohydrolase